MQVTITIDIPENHIVTLPPHVPVGRARLTVEVDDPPNIHLPSPETLGGTNVGAFVALLQSFPTTGRTREQVDQSVQDDRASWDS
jgi:hypothetical protein